MTRTPRAGRPQASTRKGESRALKDALHLHDYRFLLWWGFPPAEARKRLGLSLTTAKRLIAMIEADPQLDPERWAQDVILDEDYCASHLTQVS